MLIICVPKVANHIRYHSTIQTFVDTCSRLVHPMPCTHRYLRYNHLCRSCNPFNKTKLNRKVIYTWKTLFTISYNLIAFLLSPIFDLFIYLFNCFPFILCSTDGTADWHWRCILRQWKPGYLFSCVFDFFLKERRNISYCLQPGITSILWDKRKLFLH